MIAVRGNDRIGGDVERVTMIMRSALGLCALLACAAAPAALPAQTHAAYTTNVQSERPHAAVRGKVVSVDYSVGMIVVDTGSRRLTVYATPSTMIVRADHQYGTLSDITRGSRVEMDTVEVNGQVFAQSISLQ